MTNAKIYVTGHSLGGALALICALDLASGTADVRGVVSFGAPRIGDAQFENVYHNVMTRKGVLEARFAAINSNKKSQDVVTMVPYIPAETPVIGVVGYAYARPVQNVIVGISPACDKLSLKPCELRLHDMEGSYLPMIQRLHNDAINSRNE